MPNKNRFTGEIEMMQIYFHLQEWNETSICICRLRQSDGSVYNISLLLFCILGIIFNWMSLLVLVNKDQKLAIFTYLIAYTSTDLFYTIILTFYVLVDIHFQKAPIFRLMQLLDFFFTEVLNIIRITAMVCITLDRIHHLKLILKLCNPKMQRSQTRARLVMIVSFVLSISANLPNLFIYKCQDVFLDPDFDYLRSQFYSAYNWMYFPLFYLLPCLFLVGGNIRLVILLRRAIEKEHLNAKRGRKRNFTLTITATVIIITFVLLQIPGYLTERPHLVSMSPDLNEETRRIVISIMKFYRFVPALNSFANFFIYILLCPPFKKSLVKTLMDQRRKCLIGSSSSRGREPSVSG